jgi:hypothetical protein
MQGTPAGYLDLNLWVFCVKTLLGLEILDVSTVSCEYNGQWFSDSEMRV